MRQYGKRKFSRSLHGHWCLICHPEQDGRTGRAKARRASKAQCEDGYLTWIEESEVRDEDTMAV